MTASTFSGVTTLPAERRAELAWRVHRAADVALPPLPLFNSSPCAAHHKVLESCRACGVEFRSYQRVGASWLYLVGSGLLADTMGLGKTVQALGLLALLGEFGELDEQHRVVIVTQSGSPVMQWQAQLDRLLPSVPSALATGARKDRVERYLRPWTVLLTGSHILTRDLDDILNFPVHTLIVDDVDEVRHEDNRTAYVVKRLAADCARVVWMSGTSLQKRLHELHSGLELIGGRAVFGPKSRFLRRYVREEFYTVQVGGRTQTKSRVVGYRNLDEFVRKLAPMALRRIASDLTDTHLPAIQPQTVWLDLYPAQAQRYRELRQGVLRVLSNGQTRVRPVKAAAVFAYGSQICGGLAALGEPDAPRSSIKLDWLTAKLLSDLSEEKVVVFINNKNMLRAMAARLQMAAIGFEAVWGEVRSKKARYASQERFWDDPTCRVLLGTQAIEKSLNLQVARHLVNVDTISNAARMAQLAGRVRRVGSRFDTVYVHTLLIKGTQEEGYLPVLESEQALQDVVWGETSELFAQLDPVRLLMLIGNSSV
jgi:SNF2 family DNA or RNA helicase